MAFKFTSKITDEREANTSQWVKDRVATGAPISFQEWQSFRMNSWEREALYPLLDNDALIQTVEHFKSNCKPLQYGKATTYNESLVYVLLPILIERLRQA